MHPQNLAFTAKRRLFKLFAQLTAADRDTLLAFADFLVQRAPPLAVTHTPRTPQLIERPATETVIGAIKRLAQTYDMLDRGTLLNETSTLVSAHVLQGRSAGLVIDELETLFAQHYQQYCDKSAAEASLR